MTLPIKPGNIIIYIPDPKNYGIVLSVDTRVMHTQWNILKHVTQYFIEDFWKYYNVGDWKIISDEKEILQYLLKHNFEQI